MLLGNWRPWLTRSRLSPKESMLHRWVINYSCLSKTWIQLTTCRWLSVFFVRFYPRRTGWQTQTAAQRERRTSRPCSPRPERSQTCVRTLKKERTSCALLERLLRWLRSCQISEDSELLTVGNVASVLSLCFFFFFFFFSQSPDFLSLGPYWSKSNCICLPVLLVFVFLHIQENLRNQRWVMFIKFSS